MANSNFRTVTLDQIDGVQTVRNPIKNGTATANTKGWAAYADAAATSPVDGTGGSPNITWTRTTSSPLSLDASFLFTKDAASRQGEGVSYDFTVNSADKAKVHTINFDYEVASGTYADGDLTVWIYDVTNAQLIQPSASSILNGIGPQQKQTLSFQTNSNSTSYRLIIHCASTSAVAYTVKFDNFQVSRQSVSQGTVVTDWVSYTPTLTNGTNVSVTKVSWRRVGDSVEILGYLSVGGAGSGTDLAVSLPSGIVMDTGKINSSANNHVLGSGEWLDNGVGRFILMPVYASTTVFSFQKQQVGGLLGSDLASGDAISFTISVPIQGWSSSQQLSSDAETRVIGMRAYGYSNGTLANGATHTVVLNTLDRDDVGGYNTATGQYTVKVPGWYSIKGLIACNCTASAANNEWFAYFQVNASNKTSFRGRANSTSNVSHVLMIDTDYYLSAGDVVSIQVENTLGATLTPSTGALNSYLAIHRVAGPAQIAASAVIMVDAYGPSSTHGASAADMTGWTEIHDTHGAFDASTGTFTAPAPGYYHYNATYGPQNTATPASIFVRKNNAAYTGARRGSAYSNGAVYPNPVVFGTMWLNAGETIKFQAQNSSGSAITTDSSNTFMTIHRLGGIG